MTALPVKPLSLNGYKFTVAADEFEAHTSAVQFVPSTTQRNWTGGDGKTVSDQSPSTWVCNVDYVQDWTSDESLSQYLLANEGQTKAVTFVPGTDAADAGEFTANVVITSGPIGGTVATYGTASVSMGCDRPDFTPPTA